MERQNRSTLDTIHSSLLMDDDGIVMKQNKLWPDILECVAMVFRCRCQSSTKYSPYELVTGQIMKLPVALCNFPDPRISEDGTSAVDDCLADDYDAVIQLTRICTL